MFRVKIIEIEIEIEIDPKKDVFDCLRLISKRLKHAEGVGTYPARSETPEMV